MNDLVSIIMPSYNTEKFIKERIKAFVICITEESHLLVGVKIDTACQRVFKCLEYIYLCVAGAGEFTVSTALVASDDVIVYCIGVRCTAVFKCPYNLFVGEENYTVLSVADCSECGF